MGKLHSARYEIYSFVNMAFKDVDAAEDGISADQSAELHTFEAGINRWHLRSLEPPH